MYGRILHHCLMKSWNSLLSIGYTSYKLVSLWMSFSQCNCHLQVYHDVISQILSPHWATILFISTSYSHIQLYISWGQLDLYTLPIYLQSLNTSYIPYQDTNTWRFMALMTTMTLDEPSKDYIKIWRCWMILSSLNPTKLFIIFYISCMPPRRWTLHSMYKLMWV